MVFVFPHVLVRRPLLAISTQRNRCTRQLATKARNRARANPRKAANTNNAKSGRRAGAAPQPQGGSPKKHRGRPPPPPLRTDMPKAPHMRPGAVAPRDGWREWLVKNPIFFAAFVFPTVTIGALVLVKPNLRAQLFGWERKSGAYATRATPAPAYEGATEGAAAVGEEGATVAPPEDAANEEGMAVAKDESAIVAQGTHGVVEASAPAEESAGGTGRTGGAPPAVDWIHAIGIRSHPSS